MARLSISGGWWPTAGWATRNLLKTCSSLSPALLVAGAAAVLLFAPLVLAQVYTVDTKGSGEARPAGQNAPVDRRYAQIVPTHVELPRAPMDAKTQVLLERELQAEQGFAMRPFPRGHKGLTLRANGELTPSGESYLSMITSAGTSAKPGDRLVITDVRVEDSSIVLLINGGPDFKHRFLRHIQIGSGAQMNPIYQNNEGDPQGARLTLSFKDRVPALTARQVKALVAPLISFDVKTPIQAYTDTLPAELRDAILGHQVWVGMNIDMVLFAKGQPRTKSREMDGQMPFEEWIYGVPPEEVQFVRINGNRVIRVEIARIGEKPVIFEQDRVEGLMMASGPVAPAEPKVRIQRVGDVQRDADREAPNAPPSLRKPGDEQTLADQEQERMSGRKSGEMRPVQPPKPHAPDPVMEPASKQPGANPDEEPAAPSTPPANQQSGTKG